jgi:hypothetical protein
MKFNDFIQKQSRRSIKIVITEQQLRTLASKVVC